ncbi:MAG: hypothetical protein GY862_38090 [Gammaproteobacteria bacterium]|nr:hypothetical protein [Gammaproteobacteria bacterium]
MLSAIGNASKSGKGKPVDWWFMYKIPQHIGPKRNTTGFEFIFCDNTSQAPGRNKYKLDSHRLDQPGSAMEQTLKQVFSGNPDVGYIIWNDELPEPLKEKRYRFKYSSNSRSYGHTKGVLAFNAKENSGFYLLHSTPKFPEITLSAKKDLLVESGQAENGQTYLCITLKNYEMANAIAEVLNFNHRPQVYCHKLPGVSRDDSLYQLINERKFPKSPAVNPSIIDVLTRNGEKFKFFGKSKAWSQPKKGDRGKTAGVRTTGKDFWRDLVGPTLNCDLNVETWRNGTPLSFGDYDSNAGKLIDLNTLDILTVNLDHIGIKGYKWAFTKDHAKWGISTKKEDGWVVVADINRQISQDERGGGGLAFQNAYLWDLLRQIEVPEAHPEKGAHKDSLRKNR